MKTHMYYQVQLGCNLVRGQAILAPCEQSQSIIVHFARMNSATAVRGGKTTRSCNQSFLRFTSREIDLTRTGCFVNYSALSFLSLLIACLALTFLALALRALGLLLALRWMSLLPRIPRPRLPLRRRVLRARRSGGVRPALPHLRLGLGSARV